jgi:hypothetical protein
MNIDLESSRKEKKKPKNQKPKKNPYLVKRRVCQRPKCVSPGRVELVNIPTIAGAQPHPEGAQRAR